MDRDGKKISIYKAARSIKKRDNNLYNALKSISDDSIFVGSVMAGASSSGQSKMRIMVYGTCYFKSTDGHTNNWSFNTSRLNLHVAQLAAPQASDDDCILNCDLESICVHLQDSETYKHLPMLGSKFDRFSILTNLPDAVNFAKLQLSKGKRLLVCCHNGEDISVCVCLAILTSLFSDEGIFDDGKSFDSTNITKWEMRRRLVFVCQFAVTARPSRGNLKQVFAFLSGQRSPSSLLDCREAKHG